MMKKGILLIFTLLVAVSGFSQGVSVSGSNVITTAVPFLGIAPDSRASGIGDAGVATSGDVNSQFWNPAKYAFVESDMGVALSYTPWLRKLVDDMNIAYLTGYKHLDDRQTLSASLRYFDLGSITFYDESGIEGLTTSPNEFAIDMGYALKLTENWAGAVALRFIRSDLASGEIINGIEMTPGISGAADVAFFYTKQFRQGRKVSDLNWGINISNIGAKISYNDGQNRDFLPTNLRTGVAYTTEMDAYNKIMFTADINKLLVPTPSQDTTGTAIGASVNLGNENINSIEGIFKSFGDAPGGALEEFQEITWSLGAEYWYNEQFALRAGYFHEHENKGNRKFLTFGAGLKYNVFSFDFSYLFTLQRNHPLENTLRITLSFDIDSFMNQSRR